MKVWITKYALTKGLYEEEIEPPRAGSDYVYTKGPYRVQFRLGKDAFVDRKQAVKEADRLRRNKINSLKRQVQSLTEMTFS